MDQCGQKPEGRRGGEGRGGTHSFNGLYIGIDSVVQSNPLGLTLYGNLLLIPY